MKTILIASLLALASFGSNANNSSSAKKVGYNFSVSLQKQFGKVQNVKWSEAANNMTRASFTFDGDEVEAYFNMDGEYIGTTISRSINDLPAKLKTSVQQKSTGATIVEIVEFQNESELAYFVKVRNNDGDKILKGYSNGYLKETKL